jgi:hypothetical protein
MARGETGQSSMARGRRRAGARRVVRRSGNRSCNGADGADLQGLLVRVRPLCRGRLGSADLLGQGDDDARGAAEVAQQEDSLILSHLAEELGAAGAQAGDGVLDVVDGEHDAMQAQRVRRRVLRPGAHRRGGVVPGQLQLAVAVRGPHHRDLAPDAVQADGAVRPAAFDLPRAFQLHAELGEERDGGAQVADDDGDVVHPLNGHVAQHMTAASRQTGAEGTGGPAGFTVMPIDSVTLSDAYDPGERAPTGRSERLATSRAGLLGARLSGIMYSREGVPSCSADASDSGRADAGRR